MLGRRFRLPGYQVRRTLAGTTIFSQDNLVIKVIPNELAFSRVGIMVSAKFLAKAIARNRLKRQLSGIIDMNKVAPGFDIAVVIRKAHVH